MTSEMPQTFARRARHSSKAIMAAVALTLAGLAALALTARETTQTAVKTLGPVSLDPTLEFAPVHSQRQGPGLDLVPVVNR
ncbi:hypothetical protein [Hyphomicrobium methylovorum]|uniref:hypothetical protein n=1 Tax=Hyphomicrobium methylovorum TaxID=84 RepID=UPI0015E7A5CB|nr:hypothetical protein [Hyphomicrobium methylovorum]